MRSRPAARAAGFLTRADYEVDRRFRLQPPERATSFPLRSLACDVGAIAFAADEAFFEAQFLGMDEVPQRTLIDLEATLGDELAYGEVLLNGTLQKPDAVLTADRLWLVAAHLAPCNTAGLSEQRNPSDHRADADVKLRSCLAS